MSNWATHKIETNGLILNYHRTGGDKPPLVLSHGITDSGLCWTRLAQALEDEYNLIMVDARGHGLSDKPETGYDTLTHAEDLAELIRALGLDKPSIIGHSMGAGIAATLAATQPELVRAIVLEDPPWSPNHGSSSEAQRQERAAEWRRNLVASQSKTQAEVIADGQTQHPNWDEIEFGPWSEAKLQVAPQVTDLILVLRPWQDIVSKIACPTLLITADPELGGIVTPETVQAVQAMNSQIDQVNLPSAGHNIRREQFASFLLAVRSFLSQH